MGIVLVGAGAVGWEKGSRWWYGPQVESEEERKVREKERRREEERERRMMEDEREFLRSRKGRKEAKKASEEVGEREGIEMRDVSGMDRERKRGW